MLPSIKRCAEPMIQFRTVKFKVNLQDHGNYPSILCPLHIARTLWTIFNELRSQGFSQWHGV